jgi:hypothetical protein
MLQIVTREPADYVASLPQQSGTATILAGTPDVAVPIVKILELARLPGAPAELKELAEGILEKEYEYAMAILDEDDTGIANNLWFQPAPGGEHGPRIKVMIDPALAVRPGGKQATVPFDPTKKAEGDISPSLERQVRDFIDRNRQVLLRYWNLEYSSTKKFIADLQPLPKQR